MGTPRTLHLRFNNLKDPELVPRNTSYACPRQSRRWRSARHHGDS
ncbi:MAG TPA: sensory rhodopsin transducer [Methylocella sp.]